MRATTCLSCFCFDNVTNSRQTRSGVAFCDTRRVYNPVEKNKQITTYYVPLPLSLPLEKFLGSEAERLASFSYCKLNVTTPVQLYPQQVAALFSTSTSVGIFAALFLRQRALQRAFFCRGLVALSDVSFSFRLDLPFIILRTFYTRLSQDFHVAFLRSSLSLAALPRNVRNACSASFPLVSL